MAHSLLANYMRNSIVLLAFIAVSAHAQSDAADTQEPAAAEVQSESAEVNATVPRWNSIATADVPFYKKNFLDKLETVYTKSANIPMVPPNKMRIVIQHTSKPFKGNFQKEREALGKYILNAIVIPIKGEKLDLHMVSAGEHGEALDITSGGKKYEGYYYAFHHMDTRMTMVTCMAYVKANGRINAYFAQAVQTEFSNCKGELMDLLTTMDLWKTTDAAAVEKK